MRSVELEVDTTGRQIVDLTDRIARFVQEIDGTEGLTHIWAPHATAGGVARDERSLSDS